ncbi:hypothetical protein ES703_72431 [subsurface metagenome]
MTSEIEKIKKIIAKVEGFLNNGEGEFLYNTAKKCNRRGVIVEIGSWMGKSTIFLGKGSKAGNQTKIYAIDPHTGSVEHREKYGNVWTYKNFKENIKVAEVNDIVFPIVKTSADAAQTFQDHIEFLFIDGDHRYKMVKLDFELWYPKLLNGGIIAFHDSGSLGVRKVVKEFIYKSRNFKNIGFIGSIIYAKKTIKNSIRDRIRNRILLFVDKCAFIYHTIPFRKPSIQLRKRLFKLIR